MKMRFRTDGWHYAELKAYGWIFEGEGEKVYGTCFSDPKEKEEARVAWEATPKAEPGDVWRIHWYKQEGQGPIAGYAICCIGCGKVHHWTSARNCSGQKTQHTWTDEKGEVHNYEVCEHSGISSCWQWSGSAEENTLTGSPSLLVIKDENDPASCGWHGFIQNGDIHA